MILNYTCLLLLYTKMNLLNFQNMMGDDEEEETEEEETDEEEGETDEEESEEETEAETDRGHQVQVIRPASRRWKKKY